jgi:hypothetical protein
MFPAVGTVTAMWLLVCPLFDLGPRRAVKPLAFRARHAGPRALDVTLARRPARVAGARPPERVDCCANAVDDLILVPAQSELAPVDTSVSAWTERMAHVSRPVRRRRCRRDYSRSMR